jgi:predicted nucleic acid-binding protein
MAAYFLDTSALVKRYHPESGTPIVDQVFSEPDADLVVSRLVMVEIVSAFALKVRSGTINTSKFEQYRKQVHRDVRHKAMRVARIALRHFQLADELLCRHAMTHRLRTLDGLQLAVAIELQSGGVPATFVCADDVLCTLAKSEGLVVLNPIAPPSVP